MVAIGVEEDGHRESIGAARGFRGVVGVPARLPVPAAVPRPSRRADGCQGRPRGLLRDPGVHEASARALAKGQDQQRHRAIEPRDPQADPRGRRLPGRQVGPHARHREAQVRRGERMGLLPLPGRDAVGRAAVPEADLWGRRKARKNLDGTLENFTTPW